MKVSVKGIDISEFQGYLTAKNFEAMKRDHISFVIIRCGTTLRASREQYVDKYFENNYKEAKKASMPVGTYWNSNAKSIEEVEREAYTVLNLIRDKQFEYPIFIDTEGPDQSALSRQLLTDIVKRFCEIVQNEGHYVGIYASSSWFNDQLYADQLKDYDRWIAQWSSQRPSLSHGMWQYSSDGIVDGLSGRIDMDIAYYDYPAIMIRAGLNGYGNQTAYHIGDRVHLLEDATVYQGASLGVPIPSSIKGHDYTIMQVGEHTLLLKEIYSWVLKSQCRPV